MLSLSLLNKSLERLVIRSHYFQDTPITPLDHCYLLINQKWYRFLNTNSIQIHPCSEPIRQDIQGEGENTRFWSDFSEHLKLPQTIKYYRCLGSTDPILHLVLANKISIYLQHNIIAYHYRSKKPLKGFYEDESSIRLY